MFECFLLLRHAGDKWVPFIAIPGVLAGATLSVLLIVSGIKGAISRRHPKPKISRATSPERILQWMAEAPSLASKPK